MTVKIIETRDFSQSHNNVRTCYLGTQGELIAFGIVPPDFFNFQGRERACSRSWYGKKISAAHRFPASVEKIHVKRRAGDQWQAYIYHEIDKPPFVPPGTVWPQPKEVTVQHLISCGDDPATGENIKTGAFLCAHDEKIKNGSFLSGHKAPDRWLTVEFRGSKARLIAACLATASMFPEGKTPTGRLRREKRSPEKSEIKWDVRADRFVEDMWTVFYRDSVPIDSDDADIRKKFLQAEADRLYRKRLRDNDDNEW